MRDQVMTITDLTQFRTIHGIGEKRALSILALLRSDNQTLNDFLIHLLKNQQMGQANITRLREIVAGEKSEQIPLL